MTPPFSTALDRGKAIASPERSGSPMSSENKGLRPWNAPKTWAPHDEEAVVAAHHRLAREAIASVPGYPDTFWGRGIVICAGGAKYFTPAWVCASMLRRLGCALPIQFWHLGERELDQRMRELAAELGVTCVDAEEMRYTHPARRLGGWELKAYAILHSRFREVILLDADNVPLIDPATLFDTPEYREHGAIFWPDYGRFRADDPIWSVCEVEGREEREFESGQIVVDKQRCWAALNLAMHYNEYSDFYYAYIHGDKDTCHLAFRRLQKSYAMPSTPVFNIGGTMCQHDFQGNRIFQHRNFDKWRIDGSNRHVPDFLYEDLCRGFIKQLRDRYNGWARHAAPVADETSVPEPAVPVAEAAESSECRPEHVRAAPSEAISAAAGRCYAMPFKMFGLQRTCTNLVRFALTENFEMESLEIGAEWKHGPIGDTAWLERRGQLARVVVCVRNPYAWMASCYAYFRGGSALDSSICPRFSRRERFAAFVLREHYDWPSPVDRWNEMNRHWLSFVAAHPLRAAIVRAEDLQGIEDQVRQWERLEAALGLSRRVDPADGSPLTLGGISRRVNQNQSMGRAMDFDYYRRERYMREYDCDLLRAVNERLDWQLMERFGYERKEGE